MARKGTIVVATRENVLKCLRPGERVTRAEIALRLKCGQAVLAAVLLDCETRGLIGSAAECGRRLYWRLETPSGQPSPEPKRVELTGYDEKLQRFAQVCQAARRPDPEGVVVRRGVTGS